MGQRIVVFYGLLLQEKEKSLNRSDSRSGSRERELTNLFVQRELEKMSKKPKENMEDSKRENEAGRLGWFS